ncbi:hypothetical protein RintRC_0786 [Richelia intracellularis]|nr:hypothetical protein RintRC_0786 [Richelia intracellularis]
MCPTQVLINCPSQLHNLIVLSALAETINLLSGLKDRAVTLS